MRPRHRLCRSPFPCNSSGLVALGTLSCLGTSPPLALASAPPGRPQFSQLLAYLKRPLGVTPVAPGQKIRPEGGAAAWRLVASTPAAGVDSALWPPRST